MFKSGLFASAILLAWSTASALPLTTRCFEVSDTRPKAAHEEAKVYCALVKGQAKPENVRVAVISANMTNLEACHTPVAVEASHISDTVKLDYQFTLAENAGRRRLLHFMGSPTEGWVHTGARTTTLKYRTKLVSLNITRSIITNDKCK